MGREEGWLEVQDDSKGEKTAEKPLSREKKADT